MKAKMYKYTESKKSHQCVKFCECTCGSDSDYWADHKSTCDVFEWTAKPAGGNERFV